MSAERLSARYARSVMSLAIENNQLEEVHNDFLSIQQALNDSRDLALMVKSPIIKADQKWNVLNAVFSSNVQELTNKFLRLIVKKGRETYLPNIAKAFENQYQQLRQVTPVTITTASPLDDQMLEKIQTLLKESGRVTKTEWTKEIDEDILGGFILEFDGQVVDASVQGKLEQLKRKLV